MSDIKKIVLDLVVSYPWISLLCLLSVCLILFVLVVKKLYFVLYFSFLKRRFYRELIEKHETRED